MREREQRRVADPVAEAGARDARGTLHVEAPDLRVLLRVGDRRRFADAAELQGVVLRGALGNRVVRRVGHEKRRAGRARTSASRQLAPRAGGDLP